MLLTYLYPKSTILLHFQIPFMIEALVDEVDISDESVITLRWLG